MDRGSGVGGAPLLHEQMLDDVGLAAAADPQFVVLRNTTRDKIFEYIGRKQSSADWRRRLPELARRLEEILFRKFPNKSDYYNMLRGPMEPPLQYAIKFLSAQNTQRQLNLERSSQGASSLGYGTIMPTPGITQGSQFLFFYDSLSIRNGIPQCSASQHMSSSLGYGTIMPTPGGAPDEHVNTLLSLGMNSTHLRSRVSNNNPAPSAPAEDVPKEPKFSCPVCMNELVDASSTICGHIFCQYCIGASILAQSKCPTCRRTLSLNDFHRVYLPTME